MKLIALRTSAFILLGALLLFVLSARPGGLTSDEAVKSAMQTADAKSFTAEDLSNRTIERRAVEAAIWGMPVISFDVMRQAFFRDAKATYGDVMFWSKPGTWKLQCLTPNTSVRYIFSFTNTSQAGPVVVEVPPAGEAALMGTIMDAWQVPLTDVGLAGDDLGKGGKYLLLPPDFHGEPPAGYFAIPMKTYNGAVGLRLIVKSEDEDSVSKGLAFLKKIRIYPLNGAAAPPATKFVDMADTLWDVIPRFDESLYTNLTRILNEEPLQQQDAAIMGMIEVLGIEKGKAFKPDTATQLNLRTAAQEAHAWLMDRLVTFGQPYWSDSKWDIPVPPIAVKSGFTWEADGILNVDARGIAFYSFFLPPKKLGAGQSYLANFFDAKGQRLRGQETYGLHVPGDVPVKQFWSVTVYDHSTAGLIRNVSRASLDSYDRQAKRNGDGSMDVYFGPKPPQGMEANWIPTVAGHDWFPYFRLYGPEKPFFDKTWKLPDIEPLN